MLALRLLWRDWRGGELRILAAALVIAVAIVTAIGLFVDRLQTGIQAQSTWFLAADRVLISSQPVDAAWLQAARTAGLDVAEVVSFNSMVFVDREGDTDMQLAAVKAVSAAYPLRGQLEVAGQAFGEAHSADSGPGVGQVWVDSRLLPLLGIAMGDRLWIGETPLQVTRALISEPDRGSAFSAMGPRVMMNLEDLASTGVVQPGSRVRYRYLFAGETSQLDSFGQWLQPQLQAAQRWEGLQDNRPRLYQSLQRAEQFLMLAGAIGVGLAGIAIALAAHRYSERHYDYVAMMKALGATRQRVIALYLGNLLMLGTLALVLGAGIGWALQESVIRSLSEFFSLTTLPMVTLKPFLVGAVTSLVCLLVFAMPPLATMSGASPLRVLRRDFQPFEAGSMTSIAMGLLGTGALMYWYSGSAQLTLAVLAGVLATLLVLGGAVLLLLRTARVAGMQAGSFWRLALSALRRRGVANAVQVVIFSLALMMLLTLVTTRTSLIEDWRVQVPEGTPNHFLVNITDAQVVEFQALLQARGLHSEPLYPVVRGRVVSVNGEPVDERLRRYDPAGTGDSLQRELALTWAEQVPEGNKVIAGHWWPQVSDPQALSIESGLADRLGVSIGDRITFAIGSARLEVTIASVRSLKWDSMLPNFYMVMPPGLLDDYPVTYLTSFYLPADQKAFLNEFIRRFPTVVVIEMDQVLEQIRTIVDRVSSAIEWVLSLIVISALLVLLASVQSSLDSRFRESAILRTLGASRRLVLGSLLVEFCALGLLAGAMAALAGELALYYLQTVVLQMDYVLHPWMWLAGPVLGAVIIGFAGFFSCRSVVNAPPMRILHSIA